LQPDRVPWGKSLPKAAKAEAYFPHPKAGLAEIPEKKKALGRHRKFDSSVLFHFIFAFLPQTFSPTSPTHICSIPTHPISSRSLLLVLTKPPSLSLHFHHQGQPFLLLTSLKRR